MAKFCTELDATLREITSARHLFSCASAARAGRPFPLPKGLPSNCDLNDAGVGYLDLTGSDGEPAARLVDHGRISLGGRGAGSLQFF